MININIEKIGDYFSCEIKGHANYAEVGKDIVCASISILSQYMAFSLERLYDSPYTIESGLFNCKCYFKEEHEIWINTFIDCLFTISQKYPDNINLVVKTDE